MKSKIVYFTIFLTATTCTSWTVLAMNKERKKNKKIKLAEIVTCKEYLVGTDKEEDYQKVKSPLSPKSSGEKREKKLNLKKKNNSFSYDDNKLEELKKEFEKELTVKNKDYLEKDKKALDKEAFEEIYSKREDSFYSEREDSFYSEREDSFCEEKSESIEVNYLDNSEREDSISFNSEDDYGNDI